MTVRDLKILASQGENQFVEFKKRIEYPEKVVKEIVAFANSQGGSLFVGISDNGTLSGLKYPEEEAYVLNDAIGKYIKPGLNYRLNKISISSKKSILHYEIDRSLNRPHAVKLNNKKPETYIRVNDKSIKASRLIREIIRRTRKPKDVKFYFGDKEKLLMTYLDEHESITLEKYIEIGEISRFNASRKLILLVLANVLKVIPGEKEDIFSLKETKINN